MLPTTAPRFKARLRRALDAAVIAADTIDRLVTAAPPGELLDRLPLALDDLRRASRYCERALTRLDRRARP
jgi:hypothetical protein